MNGYILYLTNPTPFSDAPVGVRRIGFFLSLDEVNNYIELCIKTCNIDPEHVYDFKKRFYTEPAKREFEVDKQNGVVKIIDRVMD